MNKEYLTILILLPLVIMPIESHAITNNSQYAWLSSEAFLVFETNESGFEMINGGIYDDGEWKIFDTKSRSFTLSENYSLLIFAGSFEETGDQYFLTMTIEENTGDLSIWMEGENNEIVKYRDFGRIFNLSN